MKTPKTILRKEKIALRKSLSPEEQNEFSHQISEKLLSSEWYEHAHNIMLYRAMPGEVDLSEFIAIAQTHGKKLFFPRCISHTEMVALSPRDNLWTKGPFGIWEPDPAFSDPILPSALDLIICPCASFDETGNRLGMGAGYYDRFLEQCTNAHVVAVAFECQKAENVPTNEYDKKMEAIITETNLYI